MNELTLLLMAVLSTGEKDSTNYMIADYIMKNATELDDITTSSLAKACNVSKASISRFCKYIGLDDFFTLKHLIRTYYPGKNNKSKFAFEQKSDDIFQNFLWELSDRVNYLKDTLDMNMLNMITKDIYEYERVIIMGSQQSFGIAVTLQNDLASFQKFTTVCGEPNQQVEYLKTCTNKDLIIVFSATGEFFRNTLVKQNMMNRHNLPKIYLITVSDYDEYAFVSHTIQLYSKFNYSSNLLMNAYVALIGLNYKERYYQTLNV